MGKGGSVMHIRKLKISRELLTDFIHGQIGRPARVEGVPLDAKVVGVSSFERYNNSVVLEVETSQPGGDIVPVYHRRVENPALCLDEANLSGAPGPLPLRVRPEDLSELECSH
jgi:hypothetical protein